MEGLTAGDELARVALHYGLVGGVYGESQKVVCPLHEDARPSMMLNYDTGRAYCFGCGFAGNARELSVEIEKRYNGLSEFKANKRYYHVIHSTESSPIRIPPRSRSKAVSREMYAIAYDYYHGLSKVPWKRSGELDEDAHMVRDYMVDRGFLPDTLERLDARVSLSKDYKLIFPIRDNGKFKGWVSRTCDPEVEKYRKYLYNKGFRRATTVVGDYGSTDWVVVVEGFMDRAKLIQLGLDNVVAIFGWKMSAQQIQKLKDAGITKVIAATDNDEAGRRGYKWLRQNFQTTRWRYLKGIKDPGDMDARSFSRMYEKTMESFRKGEK